MPAPESLPFPPDLAGLIRERPVTVGPREYRLYFVAHIDELLESLPSNAEVPYWCILWESAIALSEWMTDHPEAVRDRSVLELGAGLGLCGLVATELGARVTQTDNHAPALRVAAENARLNRIPPPPQFLADWRQWDHPAHYDLLLGSDVVYERPIHDLLLRIFDRNLRPGGRLLLADPFRETGWEMADLLSKRHWRVELHSRYVDWEDKKTEILLLDSEKKQHTDRGR
jgi:predicted nicotinamide N-methyase